MCSGSMKYRPCALALRSSLKPAPFLSFVEVCCFYRVAKDDVMFAIDHALSSLDHGGSSRPSSADDYSGDSYTAEIIIGVVSTVVSGVALALITKYCLGTRASADIAG